MRHTFVLSLALVAFAASGYAQESTPDPLAPLQESSLLQLASAQDQLFQELIADLGNRPEKADVAAQGQRVRDGLMEGVNLAASDRCTKTIFVEELNSLLGGLFMRLDTASAEGVDRYSRLLSQFGLRTSDLGWTRMCLASLYETETDFHVYAPRHFLGFEFSKHRMKSATLRLAAGAQVSSGVVALEGWVTDGKAEGHYQGTATLNPATGGLEIDLLREGRHPFHLTGTLALAGGAYQEPLFGLKAPRNPARALLGDLTLQSDESDALMNRNVRLVARESDETLSRALNGFAIPKDFRIGRSLDVLVIEFKGADVGRRAAELAERVAEIYAHVQKDNYKTSYHPVMSPAFADESSMAIVALDTSGDVNALAAAELDSPRTREALGKLGIEVTATPLYDVGKGELRVSFFGQPERKLAFKGVGELAKSLALLLQAVSSEQKRIFQERKIDSVAAQIEAFRKSFEDSARSFGPRMDGVVAFRVPSDEAIAKLRDEGGTVAKAASRANAKIASVLVTRDLDGVRGALESYWAEEDKAFDLVGGDPGNDSRQAERSRLLSELEALGATLDASSEAISMTLDYLTRFGTTLELSGEWISASGRLEGRKWIWKRTLPLPIEAFLRGEDSHVNDHPAP